MVLLDQAPEYTSHQGPSRRNLLMALAFGILVCLGIGAAAITAFNDKPVFHDDVAYEGGYVVALAGMKADRSGGTQAFLKSGGCERWRTEQGGAKAKGAPERWLQGCRDAADDGDCRAGRTVAKPKGSARLRGLVCDSDKGARKPSAQ
ncbi:hypothetical protein N4G70_08980 [Streptomyces sp. ASQP_92]|uniref:hypothetical protein n=1 Tax=Streptomyces sp. ASQP_92 TaxID=2979116 RepID=UPI0021BE440B|nr:hypothetical protein [Streptomyces sp. ASQP_92]MCT9089001.1 hypothetical protein [Streptomyces sp. ASQP_92]